MSDIALRSELKVRRAETEALRSQHNILQRALQDAVNAKNAFGVFADAKFQAMAQELEQLKLFAAKQGQALETAQSALQARTDEFTRKQLATERESKSTRDTFRKTMQSNISAQNELKRRIKVCSSSEPLILSFYCRSRTSWLRNNNAS